MLNRWARDGGLGLKLGVFVLLLGFNMVGVATAKAASFEEFQIKAAFLFHFSHFIKWPGPQVDLINKPIVFCALDEGPVESALKELLLTSQARTHAMRFSLISDPSETSACNYLFIGSANQHEIARAIKSTDGKAILTVSDSEGFALQGGMIELARKGNRIQVLINLKNVTEHDLKVSSKLLRLATIISPSGRGSGE